MPHGPVELAAYSLAIALYLQDRRRNLPAAYVAKVRSRLRGAAGDRRRAGDMGERMRPGTDTAGAGSARRGRRHRRPAALKQPAQARRPGMVSRQRHQGRPDPTGHADPADHPRHRTATAANPVTRPGQPAPRARNHPADANGRRNSAHAQHSPSRGQSPRDPAPRARSHARPTGIVRSQAGCCPPRPCVRSSGPAWRSPPASPSSGCCWWRWWGAVRAQIPSRVRAV